MNSKSFVEPVKLVLLDDHPAILELLKARIQKIEPNSSVVTFTEVENCMQYISQNRPNFVITDLHIHVGKSLALPKYCFEHGIPFMVYTSYVQYTLLKSLEDLNCRVFVSKSSSIMELEEGIFHLIQNLPYRCSSAGTKRDLAEFIEDIIPQPIVTEAELKVLQLLVEGLTTAEISEALNLSKHTIKNHCTHLKVKNACTLHELIRRYIYWQTNG
jgi:DNA-binding NarL/FixJ family response regulator